MTLQESLSSDDTLAPKIATFQALLERQHKVKYQHFTSDILIHVFSSISIAVFELRLLISSLYSRTVKGVNPIAVGCTFRRLVAKLAGNKIMEEMGKLLGPRME